MLHEQLPPKKKRLTELRGLLSNCCLSCPITTRQLNHRLSPPRLNPLYTELKAQLVATLSSVIPNHFYFPIYYNKGLIGKRIAGLKVSFAKDMFSASLLRNDMKFLPWQLGHISVLQGMYGEFDMKTIIYDKCRIAAWISVAFDGGIQKDKRHLGDLMAGTRVELK